MEYPQNCNTEDDKNDSVGFFRNSVSPGKIESFGAGFLSNFEMMYEDRIEKTDKKDTQKTAFDRQMEF